MYKLQNVYLLEHVNFRKALIDAIEAIEATNATAIYITPPVGASGEVTDEDSGEEDGGGNLNNFSMANGNGGGASSVGCWMCLSRTHG